MNMREMTYGIKNAPDMNSVVNALTPFFKEIETRVLTPAIPVAKVGEPPNVAKADSKTQT